MKSFNNYLMVAFASASLLFIPTTFAGEEVDETLDSAGVNRVTIENLSGEVRVIGWDKSTVAVKGELDDNAEKLTFEKVGKTINIKVELPKRSKWSSSGSELVIHMPSDIRMNFDGVSSDVNLKNLFKNVAVKTVSGNIKASNLKDRVELSSVSGNITARDLFGKINLATVSGNIKDENSSGRIKLQVVSGEITSNSRATEVFVSNISGDSNLKLANVDEFKASTVSGDTTVSLFLKGNGEVKASTVSGEIKFDFQDDIAADFRLNASAGGDLINKVTNQKADHAKYGPSSKLYFQTGDANGSVRLSTVSGDVKVL